MSQIADGISVAGLVMMVAGISSPGSGQAATLAIPHVAYVLDASPDLHVDLYRASPRIWVAYAAGSAPETFAFVERRCFEGSRGTILRSQLNASEMFLPDAEARGRYPATVFARLAPDKVWNSVGEAVWVAQGDRGKAIYNLGAPASLVTKVQSLLSQCSHPRQIAGTAAGGWALIWGFNGWQAEGAPPELVQALRAPRNAQKELNYLTMSLDGKWLLVAGGNGFQRSGLPTELVAALKKANADGHRLGASALFPPGWFFSWKDDNSWWHANIPVTFAESYEHMYITGRAPLSIATNSRGEWTMLHSGNYYSWVASAAIGAALRRAEQAGRPIVAAAYVGTGWIGVAP